MSEQTLNNEVVVVTGASAGIGEAIVRTLSEKGASIILVARREDRLREIADSLNTPTFIIAQDIRETDDLLYAINEAPKPFSEVTGLVNNAGLAIGKEKLQDSDPDDWDIVIDTNIRALIRLTRGLLPGMIARRKGYILQLGSVAGRWPYRGGHVYGASKAFVRQFSLALRTDLLGTPIRVTDIEPGLVETEFSLVRFKGDEEAAAETYRGIKSLKPTDIANIVAWCLEQPPHVNINFLEVMPTDQAYAGFDFYKE